MPPEPKARYQPKRVQDKGITVKKTLGLSNKSIPHKLWIEGLYCQLEPEAQQWPDRVIKVFITRSGRYRVLVVCFK